MALEVSKTALFNPAAPIGSIFDSAMDSVEKVLDETAHKAAATTARILQAGQQAMCAISSLKGAYVSYLQQPYGQADASMKQTIDTVNDLVNALTQEDPHSKVDDLVKTLVKSAPLSSAHVPFISSVSSHLLSINAKTAKIAIAFSGNFQYANSLFFAPSFTLGVNDYSAVSVDLNKLQFEVEISSDTLREGCPYLKGDLKVRWMESYLWSWPTSTYRTLSGPLPKIPVTLTATPAPGYPFCCPPIRINKSSLVKEHSVIYNSDKGWKVTDCFFAWFEGPYDGDCGVKVEKMDDHRVKCTYFEGKGYGFFQVYFDEKQVKDEDSAPTSAVPQKEPVDLKKDF